MKRENVYMGTLVKTWMHDKNIKYVTFSVTDDCNLMCEYCYFTHKTNKNKLSRWSGMGLYRGRTYLRNGFNR